jgi:hypothetical protein
MQLHERRPPRPTTHTGERHGRASPERPAAVSPAAISAAALIAAMVIVAIIAALD